MAELKQCFDCHGRFEQIEMEECQYCGEHFCILCVEEHENACIENDQPGTLGDV